MRDSAPLPPTQSTSIGGATTEAVRELLELIAALDRRVPRVERAGEADIARDATELRVRAMKRIETLERDRQVP